MREFSFVSAGTSLYAWEAGRDPIAVIMLHGGMASHEAAAPLVQTLSERYRIVLPDVRGNGKSWFGGRLSFDQLADDVAALLDHLKLERAVIGGVSGGSGIALRVALRHPSRLRGLVMVQPVYAGRALGYTPAQRETFAAMDAVASRALAEGTQVLRPMYAQLPEGIRSRALAMLETFDAASVVATSRFLASGAQPFSDDAELRTLARIPTLLVRGNDPLHPDEISRQYEEAWPQAQVIPAGTPDVAAAIGVFTERLPA